MRIAAFLIGYNDKPRMYVAADRLAINRPLISIHLFLPSQKEVVRARKFNAGQRGARPSEQISNRFISRAGSNRDSDE